MAATPQPITGNSSGQDVAMLTAGGSYNNGSFNPASYTRQFLGTPLSWKPGSFGNGFPPEVSPSQFFSSIDNFGRVPASLDSDKGSHMKLDPYVAAREKEFSQNFNCCGVSLKDLHAVVEHFEMVHVVVADPGKQEDMAYQNAFSGHQATGYSGHFDPDDMEIDDEDGTRSTSGSSDPSAPHTPPTVDPSNSNLSSKPTSKGLTPLSTGSPPISAFDTTIVSARGGPAPMSAFPSRRDGYSAYNDYASGMQTPAQSNDLSEMSGSEPASPTGCVPPALVFSTTKPLSRGNSLSGYFPSSSAGPSSPVIPSASNIGAASSSTMPLSQAGSSLLLSKPFRCPKPNCNKSYKQANGLKYHMTHGSCNFAPPKDLEQVQALLARKRSELAQAAGDGEPYEDMALTEGEMREVELEAERQLRPFACSVGDCTRRYKNMNGLRYHYQHSGEHGAVGLALLASGQHECLSHAHRAHQAAARNISSPNSGRLRTPGGSISSLSALTSNDSPFPV